MKRFFSFIIKQSVAIVLCTVFVLAFGIYCTAKMPLNLLPDINVPVVCVQTIYAGANAQSVEKDVTQKLEDGLSGLSGITSVTSYSYDNLSAVVLYFDYGTDTDGIKTEIREKLSGVALPDGVTSDVYDIDLNAQPLATLSVTSTDGFNDEQKLRSAYEAAKSLSASISAVSGVESVSIKGGATENIAVTPFAGLELLTPLIVQAFSYGQLDLPLGSVTESGGSVQIRNNTDVKCYDDILNTPLTLPAQIVTLLKTVKAGIFAECANMGYDLTDADTLKTFTGNPLYLAAIVQKLRENELAGALVFSVELVRFILLSDFETPASSGGAITSDGGMTVKTGDIARVERSDDYSSYVYYADGRAQLVKGTVIEVYKSNGANSSAVVDSVKSLYSAFLKNGGRESGISVTLLDDQSEFISDSISNVLVSMLIGGVLAIAVIFLFLKKVRTSLIVAITMPLSVLAALICLYVMGITLNMVSLGGLAVGIGMLVDNSIVVIESISKHRDMGKSAFEAAVDGTAEVGGALFGSTLTTVCVFIPIIFSGGLTGEIFTDLSWAVIFSLAFSLIVALTAIPAFYAMFNGKKRMLKGSALAPSLPDKKGEEPVAVSEPQTEKAADAAVAESSAKSVKKKRRSVMESITEFYGRILPKILSKKLVTLLVAVVVFGASVGLLFVTGTEFLPSIDKGQVEVTMSFGADAQLDKVERGAFDFAEAMQESIDGIDYMSVSVGKNGLLALTDTAVITVQMKKAGNTKKTVKTIRALAEKDSFGGSVRVREIDGIVAALTSGSAGLSVTIKGEDISTLAEISGKITQKLKDSGFKDVTDTSVASAKEYDLKFDRYRMEQLGLDYQTLVLTLRIGIASHTACTVTIDGNTYNLKVSFADGVVTGRESLENFVVGASGTSVIKLKDICEITETNAETCITRSDGKRMITLSADLPDTDTGAASRKMQDIASGVLKDYKGYEFETSGVSGYLSDAFGGLAVALVISLFLLYAVMAVQFGSALKPLIIMASIPFCFTGGFVALVITGTTLNVVSFIGLIMLMGVVVNNAIVMLEKIKQLVSDGMEHYTAVVEACKVRLRPIFMTTLTTVLALIPMAIGVGRGSELMQPLGIVVIGGLLLGTLVTLLIVPALYCAVNRVAQKRSDQASCKRSA